MELKKEYDLYLKCKKIWLDNYEWSFVLIKDDIVAGFFGSEIDAYEFGLGRFGDVPMLIQWIVKEEPVVRIFREDEKFTYV